MIPVDKLSNDILINNVIFYIGVVLVIFTIFCAISFISLWITKNKNLTSFFGISTIVFLILSGISVAGVDYHTKVIVTDVLKSKYSFQEIKNAGNDTLKLRNIVDANKTVKASVTLENDQEVIWQIIGDKETGEFEFKNLGSKVNPDSALINNENEDELPQQ